MAPFRRRVAHRLLSSLGPLQRLPCMFASRSLPIHDPVLVVPFLYSVFVPPGPCLNHLSFCSAIHPPILIPPLAPCYHVVCHGCVLVVPLSNPSIRPRSSIHPSVSPIPMSPALCFTSTFQSTPFSANLLSLLSRRRRLGSTYHSVIFSFIHTSRLYIQLIFAWILLSFPRSTHPDPVSTAHIRVSIYLQCYLFFPSLISLDAYRANDNEL
ncbi:hypothetical protein C8R45DRAFT_1011829 [Mycena sanguinolenta]|nr:hypothetical protein C8R45DRAFT_1011829 [Mycena sanguinolenta]